MYDINLFIFHIIKQHYSLLFALFILNSSAHVLSATNRFDPECEPHLDEVLNQDRKMCDYNDIYLFIYFV